MAMGSMLNLLPLLFRGGGGKGKWLILAVVALLLVFGGGLGGLFGSPERVHGEERAAPNDEAASFVGYVLDDVQGSMEKKLTESGLPYRRAKLVLFSDATETSCGYGAAATGPFYCPADERVYIDLGFFRELDQKLGAPGDFAQAYVVAHEIGHHIQRILGYSDKVHDAPRAERSGPRGMSVRLELQADCLAGVWANTSEHRDQLEPGDIQEALGAAAAIGDDRLQRQSRGTVNPETFSHGTSAQRATWFERGLRTGKVEACDTFSGAI
jgi:predicted metalloprotease